MTTFRIFGIIPQNPDIIEKLFVQERRGFQADDLSLSAKQGNSLVKVSISRFQNFEFWSQSRT